VEKCLVIVQNFLQQKTVNFESCWNYTYVQQARITPWHKFEFDFASELIVQLTQMITYLKKFFY
jgi:hypothetical protein